MDSLVFYRSPQSSGWEDSPPYPVTTTDYNVTCHPTSPMNYSGGVGVGVGGAGTGTSTELAWELIDIFESGMFAFPIYDHDSARDIVRYLLERGILEEEIADAIKDSTVDMNIWLEKGDKYMVGEWVIAWINACRENYVKQKQAHGAATVLYGGGRGGRKRPAAAALDGSTDSLGHPMDDDDDAWGGGEGGGGLSGGNEEDEEGEEECGGAYRGAEMCGSSAGGGFGGVPSYSSGLSFSQCGDTSDEATVKWSASSPSSPPTPFHRLAPYLRRIDQPGGASAGARRKNIGAVCWRSVTSPSLQHLLQTVVTDEKSDSGIVSDLFDRVSHDYDDDGGGEEEEVEVVEVDEHQSDKCMALQKSTQCNGVDASFGARCTCKLPHYASYPSSPSPGVESPCPSWGKDDDEEESSGGWHESAATGGGVSAAAAAAAAAARSQGQYYKDFIIRALEYTLETLDRDGPGYLFIMTDSEDRPVTWSNEKRFRVASSSRPDVCLAAYRSRNIDVDLLWQVRVSHHCKMALDVHAVLEKYRLHSNWFRCRLSTVMETVYAVMSRYQAINTRYQMSES